MEYFHDHKQAWQHLRQLVCVALATGVSISAGCSKHQPSGAPDSSTAVSTPNNGVVNPAQAADPKVVPVTILPSGPDPAVLAQLTQVLRRFSVEHRQVPKSLDELIAAGYLTALPAAPAGKQFAIEPKHLEVVLR